MSTAFLADIRDTIIPDRDGRHGPLPPLLLSMTVSRVWSTPSATWFSGTSSWPT